MRDAEGKQRVIVELYDKFFTTAFKKTVDRLGIVYTPIEIVDFILRSADEVLREEFGKGLTDEGVHILDGFTGTGTFIVRLLQSGLITPHDLARKYATELHANEILLLAYYIAAVNIETTYAALTNGDSESGTVYEPFTGLVLTDTFQSYEDGDRNDLDIFPANNERIERQRQLPITVIVGNPPYSVGQDSANDDNQNAKYPTIDAAIRDTYAALSSARSTRTLYDSYIRAIKWASLRIKDRGVIAFVTNGGFLDANTADGMRKSLASEFSNIHVFNLRGNRRNAGAEGRPIFEAYAKGAGGSIAGIAVIVLVKNPEAQKPCQVHYAQVGDYTTAQEKVAEIVAAGSVFGTGAKALTPNVHGDWLNQRRDDFETFLPIGDKAGDATVFARFSLGLATGRDAWAYNYSRPALEANVRRMLNNYNAEVEKRNVAPDYSPARRPMDISWNRNLEADFAKGRRHEVQEAGWRTSAYRPFTKQRSYFDQAMNAMLYQQPRLFPTAVHGNLGFSLTGPASHFDFCLLAADALPDLHLLDTGQFFPRWTWEKVDDQGFDFGGESEAIDGYRRIDNITDEALRRFVATYGDDWTKDDIFYYCYGLLHSPDYRQTYAADLKKMLPRIPLVADAANARAFADAGQTLIDLHVGYESVEPYPLDGLYPTDAPDGDAAYAFYAVTDKKMSFGKPTPELKAAGEKVDRSVIHYNDRITLRGIPQEAYRYRLGSRSAIEWIIDRYYVKTDKPSGIVNDPNAWAREIDYPRYILDLLARVVTVSVETMRVVDTLPTLEIRTDQCAVHVP